MRIIRDKNLNQLFASNAKINNLEIENINDTIPITVSVIKPNGVAGVDISMTYYKLGNLHTLSMTSQENFDISSSGNSYKLYLPSFIPLPTPGQTYIIKVYNTSQTTGSVYRSTGEDFLRVGLVDNTTNFGSGPIAIYRFSISYIV